MPNCWAPGQEGCGFHGLGQLQPKMPPNLKMEGMYVAKDAADGTSGLDWGFQTISLEETPHWSTLIVGALENSRKGVLEE